jgi:hypothetical protein
MNMGPALEMKLAFFIDEVLAVWHPIAITQS